MHDSQLYKSAIIDFVSCIPDTHMYARHVAQCSNWKHHAKWLGPTPMQGLDHHPPAPAPNSHPRLAILAAAVKM